MTITARSQLLTNANRLVNNDRNHTYGQPADDFGRTARMWQAYLGHPVKAHDVAALLILLKTSRLACSPDHQDSWTDIAGYAACGWECVRPNRESADSTSTHRDGAA